MEVIRSLCVKLKRIFEEVCQLSVWAFLKKKTLADDSFNQWELF